MFRVPTTASKGNIFHRQFYITALNLEKIGNSFHLSEVLDYNIGWPENFNA